MVISFFSPVGEYIFWGRIHLCPVPEDILIQQANPVFMYRLSYTEESLLYSRSQTLEQANIR